MSQTLDRVFHRAVRILVCRNTTLHQRLYEASKEISAAIERPELWPQDLLPQAQSIHASLTAQGKIVDTVCDMDTPVAAEVAEDILNLAVQIAVAKRQRLDAQGHLPVPCSKATLFVEMPRKAATGR